MQFPVAAWTARLLVGALRTGGSRVAARALGGASLFLVVGCAGEIDTGALGAADGGSARAGVTAEPGSMAGQQSIAGPAAGEGGQGPVTSAGGAGDGNQGCAPPAVACGGGCVDTSASVEHCGQCDLGCPPGASCESGACGCPAGQAACADGCVDVLASEQHCGACGQPCDAGLQCVAGNCECPASELLCNGACVDTAGDAQNCGGCGLDCTERESCTDGECVCQQPLTRCGALCADTANDSNNCGSCGVICGAGLHCEAAECVCAAGYASCGDSCVELASDAAHCGECTIACAPFETCSAGVCTGGGPGDDGCEGLAGGLSIREVSTYQTVRIPLMEGGSDILPRASELVAGRKTLFRVYFDLDSGFEPRELSARLWLGAGDDLLRHYSTRKLNVAGSSQSGDRNTAFEFEVPGAELEADTAYAVEVVECAVGQSERRGRPRYPEAGTVALSAIEAGPLRIHLVPFDFEGNRPQIDATMLSALEAGFMATYPIDAVELSVDSLALPVTGGLDWSAMLEDLAYRRYLDAAPDDVYYYGLLNPTASFQDYCYPYGCIAGVGYIPTDGVLWDPSARVAMGLGFAGPEVVTTALHEVGHNHGRLHAPCQVSDGVDDGYPYSGGRVGVEGWDSRSDVLLPPTYTDFMGYCSDNWFSDYTYNGLLDTVRLVNHGVQARRFEPAREGEFRMLHLDPLGGVRWGKHVFSGPVGGATERAVVFDQDLQPLQTITVFRRTIADAVGYSVYVPLPSSDWAALQLSDTGILSF